MKGERDFEAPYVSEALEAGNVVALTVYARYDSKISRKAYHRMETALLQTAAHAIAKYEPVRSVSITQVRKREFCEHSLAVCIIREPS